ncbi:MAG: aminopeptidase P family protein [Chloroflexi bacterium]|nr:aminopeptidase P family protein [Chloroflexota bacterium]
MQRLRALMTQRGVDAVAVVPSANLFYLTGLQMHLSERVTLALFTRDAAHLIVPALEVPRVETRTRVPLTLHGWSDAEWVQAGWASLKKALSLDGCSIAADYYSVRALELTQLQNFARDAQISDASELLGALRMTKDAAEMDAMRRAVRVLETSMDALLHEVRVGKTERELAARWQWLMFEHGADGIPEAPIVASGPNSAQPHTTSTARALAEGDLLILDGWCTVDGYFGDITRTFAIGAVSDELKHIYDLTLRANQAGRAAAKPGAQGQDVDRAARKIISDAGYGEFFMHRTGHGLGLEIHEAPNIVEGNTLTLTPGMTFTVEPGIYLPGKGGVRIEDDVVVTQDGAECLMTYPRELRVI